MAVKCEQCKANKRLGKKKPCYGCDKTQFGYIDPVEREIEALQRGLKARMGG